jgi:Putative DNA-binding domain
MKEADFNHAIRSVEAGVPHPRFPVYRNNVASGLVNALAVRFPVTEQLVGKEFFCAMAALFVEVNKPQSPVLIHYGAELASFIDSFGPAKQVAYLGDVARLETLWWTAYHAREAEPAPAQELRTYRQDVLGELRFLMHPSVGVMSSPFAIAKLWHAHHGGAAIGSFATEMPDQVVVSRPHAHVDIRSVSHGFGTFVDKLKADATLFDAVSAAIEADPEFSLPDALAALFSLNLVTGVRHV